MASKNSYGARQYSARWKQARLALTEQLLGEIQPRFVNAMQKSLVEFCRRFQTEQITGSHNIPVYTGNAKDSTGLVVYRSGRIVSMFYPQQTATTPQRYQHYRRIWGSAEFQKMRKAGTRDNPKGLSVALYSAVPYASDLNMGRLKRGRKVVNYSEGIYYFDSLSSDFRGALYTFVNQQMSALIQQANAKKGKK